MVSHQGHQDIERLGRERHRHTIAAQLPLSRNEDELAEGVALCFVRVHRKGSAVSQAKIREIPRTCPRPKEKIVMLERFAGLLKEKP